MSQTQEISGVDLARVALRAAREAAKKNGARTPKSKPRLARTVRRDGRAPMGLGEAFTALIAEHGWDIPTAGASLCERWAALAPDLAGHVTAVGFDPDSGRLTLCPESTAWATKTRLEQTRVIEAANMAAGRIVLRALRILQPGAVPAAEPADVVPVAPSRTTMGPVKTRETASAGYRRALAAHQEAAPPRQVDPAIAEAVERQTKVMRQLGRRAFPEPDVVPSPIEAARAERRRHIEAVQAAAVRRARADKAGLPRGETKPSPGRTD
ncbi:DciA family protein [Streptomyces sp. NPDC023588]|uniref:DciA family protein n=1 Tax=Streptomyces sp. NPDC023588 TaxID=3154907 RepID=UPI0033F712FA